MKIDLSTIALILLAVLPGYCSFKVRNLFAPRSFAAKGPTEELASFVAVSVLVQTLIVLICAAIAAVAGLATFTDVHHYFDLFDSNIGNLWTHASVAALLAFAYVGVACVTGGVLGLPLALFQLGGLAKIWAGVTQEDEARVWLKRHGIRGLLGERPIIYEALTPSLDDAGNEQILFLEVELKDSAGFYAGQVASYTVLKDEEPHKLILLKSPFFKSARLAAYEELHCDQLLLDLTDVLVLQVRAQPNLPPGQHASLDPVADM